MRDEHPTPDELEALLHLTLTPARQSAVLAHLLLGCPRCSAEVRRGWLAMLRPGQEEPAGDGAEYDMSIARAMRAARRRAEAMDQAKAHAWREVAVLLSGGELPPGPPLAPGERAWGRVEALLDAAQAFRYEDPEAMVLLATTAVTIAEGLSPEDHPRSAVADLQARAWTGLGNAHRVADELDRAERALRRAFARAGEGSGDLLLLAHLMDLTASLYIDQRRFGEADQLLDMAYQTYLCEGQDHMAGKTLIKKGRSAGYVNDFEEGIRLVMAGMRLIDRGRDPVLTLIAIHNLIHWTAMQGQFLDARQLLWRSRPLYTAFADELNLLKLAWLEADIAAGLGETEAAEKGFHRVRRGFAERGMPLTAAVAGLELGALWVPQGRTGEVVALVDEMLAEFRQAGIGREAIAALLLLREAVVAEAATAAMIKAVAARLRELERDPVRPPGA